VIVPLFAAIIIAYLILSGILIYRDEPRKEIVIYYSISLSFAAISMLLYSFTPFLKKGQNFYAEITLGGSLILMVITILIYIQYWHTLYREIPVISKLFYLASGASLISIFNNPWEIYYLEGLGFHQDISFIFSAILAIMLLCGIYILLNNLFRVRKIISSELEIIEGGLHQYQKNKKYSQSLLKRQTRLLNNKKSLNWIILFWLVGIILIIIGIILPGETAFNSDAIGTLLVFLPQAYFITRDKRLLTSLQVEKVRLRARRLKESLVDLDKELSPQIPEQDIQALLKFIEKGDALLYFQEQFE
jgi:hypothetical protein